MHDALNFTCYTFERTLVKFLTNFGKKLPWQERTDLPCINLFLQYVPSLAKTYSKIRQLCDEHCLLIKEKAISSPIK